MKALIDSDRFLEPNEDAALRAYMAEHERSFAWLVREALTQFARALTAQEVPK